MNTITVSSSITLLGMRYRKQSQRQFECSDEIGRYREHQQTNKLKQLITPKNGKYRKRKNNKIR